MKWWQTDDLVARQATLTRQKMSSGLDKLAAQQQLIREQEERKVAERGLVSGRQMADHLTSVRRWQAADEINAANKQLTDLGVEWNNLIPVSESTIKQQITSGRTWVNQYVGFVEQEKKQVEWEAIQDLRNEARASLIKEGMITADSDPNMAEQTTNARMATLYAEQALEEGRYEDAQYWNDIATKVGSGQVVLDFQYPNIQIIPKMPERWTPQQLQEGDMGYNIIADEQGIPALQWEIMPQDIGLPSMGHIEGAGTNQTRFVSPTITLSMKPDVENPDKLGIFHNEKQIGHLDYETGEMDIDYRHLYKTFVPSPFERIRLEKMGYMPGGREELGHVIAKIENWLGTPKESTIAGETVTLPPPNIVLGIIGFIGTVVTYGAQGISAVNQFINTNQTIGSAYARLPGVNPNNLPKVPVHAGSSIADQKVYRAYQNTGVYQNLLRLSRDFKVPIGSKRFNVIDAELYRAYHLLLGGDTKAAQAILDKIRFETVRAFPGAVKPSRAVTPYTGVTEGATPLPTTTPKVTPTVGTGGQLAVVPPTGGMAISPGTQPIPIGGIQVPAMAEETVSGGQLEAARNEIQRELEYAQGRVTELRQELKQRGGTRVRRAWVNNELARNNQLVAEYGRLLRENDPEELIRYAPREIAPPVTPEVARGITLPDYKVFDDKTYRLTGVFTNKSGATTPTSQVVYGKDFSGNVGYGRYELAPERPTITPEAITPKEITALVTETVALAEEGTITGEIPEGEVVVTGLEPVRVIRNLQSQYATQKLPYDAVKKELIDYTKANLPKDVQGKMLTSVKNVKTEAQLKKALDMANKYAEASVQKTLKTKITNELRKITPRTTAGYKYGKFTAETQKQLNAIRQNTGMDREMAKAEILRNIEAAEDGKMTFEQADAANDILSVSGLKGMSSDELAHTLREVKSLKETGRGIRTAEREAETVRVEKLREDVIGVITGGKGIKPGEGTVNTRDMWAREGKAKSFLTNWQYGMDDVLDKLSRFDKASQPFQSPLSQLGFNLHMSRSTQQMGVIKWVDGRTADKVKEIYGVKGRGELNRFLGGLTNEKIKLGTFANTEGQQVTLSLTKDQIIQKYLELQDPTLDETFRIGMEWTDEMINAVKDSMTAGDIKYADWLAKEYQNYGKEIKPIFEAKYHIPFPENPNYVPINRDLEGSYYEHLMLAQDNYRYAGVTNNSLKARVKNRIPLRFNGATQVWVRHVVQMEHFKAFAQSMKEARMVFGNRDVRTAIRQYHGNDILKHLDRHLDQIARDGIDRALIVGGVDKLRGHFTLAALGVKVAVSAKQALSLPAYLTYQPMPLKDFFTGVADFYKHPMANIREMKELSGYFSERWGRGHERDVRLVKEKDVAGRLSNAKNWRDLLMLGIHKVDTAVTQPGSWAVYQSMRKQGMSKPEAITHAEVATKRSQPSFGLEDMAALRKHGSFGKLFTMFQSQPNKYYRLIADSARNLKAGRGSKGRNILNILLAWWVLPMMFQLVSDAFQWKGEHQARVAILGPANYLLTAGQILQSAYGWVSGEPFPAEASPVFSTLRELQYAITGAINLLEQGKDPTKEIDTDYLVSTIEHWAKAVGQVTGLPTPYVVQVERAIRNADIRQMVFSQYALKSEDDAVRKLLDIYLQEVPGATEDKFYELRPDLK